MNDAFLGKNVNLPSHSAGIRNYRLVSDGGSRAFRVSFRGIKWPIVIVIAALAGFGVGLILNGRNPVLASNSKVKLK